MMTKLNFLSLYGWIRFLLLWIIASPLVIIAAFTFTPYIGLTPLQLLTPGASWSTCTAWYCILTLIVLSFAVFNTSGFSLRKHFPLWGLFAPITIATFSYFIPYWYTETFAPQSKTYSSLLTQQHTLLPIPTINTLISTPSTFTTKEKLTIESGYISEQQASQYASKWLDTHSTSSTWTLSTQGYLQEIASDHSLYQYPVYAFLATNHQWWDLLGWWAQSRYVLVGATGPNPRIESALIGGHLGAKGIGLNNIHRYIWWKTPNLHKQFSYIGNGQLIVRGGLCTQLPSQAWSSLSNGRSLWDEECSSREVYWVKPLWTHRSPSHPSRSTQSTISAATVLNLRSGYLEIFPQNSIPQWINSLESQSDIADPLLHTLQLLNSPALSHSITPHWLTNTASAIDETSDYLTTLKRTASKLSYGEDWWITNPSSPSSADNNRALWYRLSTQTKWGQKIFWIHARTGQIIGELPP